jgi:hypothetical protein
MAKIYEVSGIGETTVVQLPLEDCEGRRGRTLRPVSTLRVHRVTRDELLYILRIISERIPRMVQTSVC